MSKTVRIGLAVVIVLILGLGLIYTGIWINSYRLIPFSNPWGGFGWNIRPMLNGGTCGAPYYFNGFEMRGRFIQGIPNLLPLSLDEVELRISQYLDELSDPDLLLSEIIIFDNHAYAQIIEKSTGIGAMEVLIDPQTKHVYPEHGPNLMWNMKYSPMSQGTGMMHRYESDLYKSIISAEEIRNLPVSGEEAVASAQEYLDQYQPGYDADEHTALFYGYYNIHVLENDHVVGMLSVNGYSGQVFYHDWHGELIEMSER